MACVSNDRKKSGSNFVLYHGISAEKVAESTLAAAHPNTNEPPPYVQCMCHQNEREKVDSRILEEALAGLALQHRAKLSALDLELKEDENKVRGAFERERVSGWKGVI